ncbi:MAG TPA: hypothetical protein VIS96_09645 [Terrimicrobiaceae bacterium]
MQSHEHTDGDEREAMDELARHMRAVKERRDSVTDEELRAALATITEALTHHWSTGGGTRLRRFIWSLWNDWHLVNLYHLCSGLDLHVGRRSARSLPCANGGSADRRPQTAVLKKSGEFARDGRRRVLRRRKMRMSSILRWRSRPKIAPD